MTVKVALEALPCLRSIVVVVDDASSDRTSEVARQALAGMPHLIGYRVESNVGRARSEGVSLALRELPALPLDRIWLAFTDADTVVPEDWLIRQLIWAEAGATGVAGIVQLPASESAENSRYEGLYSAGIWSDGHQHVHGANMGVIASQYVAVGGFADLRVGEDTDLWRRMGSHVVADPRLVVETSARRQSRVVGGLATYLSQLSPHEAAK